MSLPKLLFLSSHNPFSKKAWSGIPYFLFTSLTEHFDVQYVPLPEFRHLKLLGYFISRSVNFLTQRKYVFDYGFLISRLYGIVATLRIRRAGSAKFIFSPAGLTEVAFLKTSIPIISYGDCSVLQLLEYYPAMSNVLPLSWKELKYVEQKALSKTTFAIFSSEWASDFVSKTYHRKCFTIPFGANMTTSFRQVVKADLTTEVRLLWIGVDWIRKGGDIAYSSFRKLRSKGVKCTLTLIGTEVPDLTPSEYLTVIPRIDKDNEKEAALLHELYSESHFLVLPTRADCTPIVIAEAFAHSLPVVACRTGGLVSMVSDGETGYLLGEDADEFVNVIMALRHDHLAYARMRENCFSSYMTMFNWKTWAESLKTITDL